MADTTTWLTGLVREGVSLERDQHGVWDALPEPVEPGSSAPFEGAYGHAYSAMIRSRRLRRAFFGAWGGAEVLYELDALVVRAGRHAAGRPLLDVPSGRGIVATLLADGGVTARVAGLDLAHRALVHATHAAEQALTAHVSAAYVRGTALELPFRDGAFPCAVSINGLHVMPDHDAFMAELARVLEPGGQLWLVTPVSGPGLRGAGMLRAGLALGVLSQRPPTAAGVDALARKHGFDVAEDLGGRDVVGRLLVRR